MERTEWEEKACNFLKVELARKGMNYDDLKAALEKIGIVKSKNNINVTINRGKYSFVFFLQCCQALDIKKLDIDI